MTCFFSPGFLAARYVTACRKWELWEVSTLFPAALTSVRGLPILTMSFGS